MGEEGGISMVLACARAESTRSMCVLQVIGKGC